MNRRQNTETEFERSQRAVLRRIVAERGAAEKTARSAAAATPAWRRRGLRLGLAAAAVGAVAAAALIVDAGGGTPPAFAVEPQPDGTLSVEIRSPEDPRGLEGALAQAGVPASVTYLPPGTACREPRFRAAPWPRDAHAIVVGSPQGAPSDFPIVIGPTQGVPPRVETTTAIVGGPGGADAVVQEEADGDGPATFWISRAAVGPGQTLVVTVSAGAEGTFDADAPIQVTLAEGTVSACEPVPAQPGSNSGG